MRTRPSPHHFEPSHTNSTTTPISGYFELFGVDEGVKQQLYKLASISLCSNTVGQVRTHECAASCHSACPAHWVD